MKKNLIIAGLCLGLISSKTTFSQNSEALQYDLLAVSQRTNDAVEVPPGANEANVNSKAVVHFREAYPAASKTSWTSDAKGSTVRFISSGISMSQNFDLKGRWRCTIKNFDLNQVPEAIAQQVMEAYPECRIFFAQQRITPLGEAYVIKIESTTDLKTLVVSANGIDEMESFEK